MTRETLLALAARAEAAEGPDRELDADIGAMFFVEPKRSNVYRRGRYPLQLLRVKEVFPPYTKSLDAAMTLVPADLFPTIDFVTKRVWIRNAKGFDVAWTSAHGFAATVPLSICAAALRARAGDGA